MSKGIFISFEAVVEAAVTSIVTEKDDNRVFYQIFFLQPCHYSAYAFVHRIDHRRIGFTPLIFNPLETRKVFFSSL